MLGTHRKNTRGSHQLPYDVAQRLAWHGFAAWSRNCPCPWREITAERRNQKPLLRCGAGCESEMSSARSHRAIASSQLGSATALLDIPVPSRGLSHISCKFKLSHDGSDRQRRRFNRRTKLYAFWTPSRSLPGLYGRQTNSSLKAQPMWRRYSDGSHQESLRRQQDVATLEIRLTSNVHQATSRPYHNLKYLFASYMGLFIYTIRVRGLSLPVANAPVLSNVYWPFTLASVAPPILSHCPQPQST